MTTPDLDALLKIAEAATPGPWVAEAGDDAPDSVFDQRRYIVADVSRFVLSEDGIDPVHANAAHIAAFNPTVAKALVMGMQVLAEAAQAMHGTGPLSRVDPSDTLDEIGMKAEAALSALTLALKGSNHG